MIWHYLMQFFIWLMRLVVPPSATQYARVRPDAQCPVCGTTQGRIRCVKRGTTILAQHTCGECGARWHESPVVRVDAQLVWPSIARNDLELKEELSAASLRADVAMGRPQPVKPVEVRNPPAWKQNEADTGRVEIREIMGSVPGSGPKPTPAPAPAPEPGEDIKDEPA